MGNMWDRCADSFFLLFRNPILFVPAVYSLVFMGATALFAFFYSGAFSFFSSFDLAQLESQQLELYRFFSENFLRVAISLITFLVATFVVGVSASAWKYTLITKIVHGQKPKTISSYRESLGYFWTVVLLNILLFLLYIGLGVISALILSLSFLWQNLFFGWLLILLVFILFVVFRLAILFRYPFLFMKHEGAYASLKKSGQFFFEHKPHVAKIFLCMLSIWLVGFLAMLLINALFFAFLPSLAIIENILVAFLYAVGSLWSELFLFKNL